MKWEGAYGQYWRAVKYVEGSSRCVLTVFRHLLMRTDEDFENSRHDRRPQERETNLGLPRYEADNFDVR
jgi:hypothetical protein